MNKFIALVILSLPFFSQAGEWCDLASGFGITENSGTISVNGTVKNSAGTGKHQEWLVLNVSNNTESTQARLALIMSAKMANLTVRLYARDTCEGLANWTPDQVIHVRI